jgi:DNA-binding CsgD family transcriptional regulator
MAQREQLTTRKEREALRSIKRACYAGLDSIALRSEVARRVARIVPTEACGLAATDPETGLFTHGWIDGIPDRLLQEYMEAHYLDEVADFLDLAASGATATTQISEPYREQLRGYGLGRGAHAVFCSDGEMWGAWCTYREGTSRPFGEREIRFMRAVAAHVGYGLRFASMREAAATAGNVTGASAPGVIVLDIRGQIKLTSGPATSQLVDLANVGTAAESVSYAVGSVLARLRTLHSAADGPLRVGLRAQGISGRWYILHGSLAEPDAAGDTAAVIVIEPDGPRETATSVSYRYGLSPREREVLLLVIRGESTKRIAGRLGLSPYTVQDHLDHVCEKIGVRGRKALLARILADRLASGARA